MAKPRPVCHKMQETICKYCGKPFMAKAYLLKRGEAKFCSVKCSHAAISEERRANPQTEDLMGQKFGKWTVIGPVDKLGHNIRWKCRCECGNEAMVGVGNLKTGKSVSCGCYKSKLTSERNTTHGMKPTRLYRVWNGMKARCQIPSSSGYYKYGARGIKVCEEWQNFEPFKEWALANGYRDDLQIDRIDVYGNYEPSNCRFVTNKENALNKRNTRYLTLDGVTKTVIGWADTLGISERTIRSRLSRGRDAIDVLTTPIGYKRTKGGQV